MAEASRRLGFRQSVKQPTRGKYLLDVVLTDVFDCEASPHSAVADHKSVVTKAAFKVLETASRTQWKCGSFETRIGTSKPAT